MDLKHIIYTKRYFRVGCNSRSAVKSASLRARLGVIPRPTVKVWMEEVSYIASVRFYELPEVFQAIFCFLRRKI